MGYLRPLVRQAEIRTLLVDPSAATGFDIDRVDVWYLCRVLGILSQRSARIVLRLLGEHLARNPHSSVVIINALRDHNPDYEATHSRLYTLKFILGNLQKGIDWEFGRRSGTKAEVLVMDTYRYFDKTVASLHIKAVAKAD
jgi:hypothetical protein